LWPLEDFQKSAVDRIERDWTRYNKLLLHQIRVRYWPIADLSRPPAFIFLTKQLEFNRKTASDPKRTFAFCSKRYDKKYFCRI